MKNIIENLNEHLSGKQSENKILLNEKQTLIIKLKQQKLLIEKYKDKNLNY
jgi:hypothetical protein